MSEGECEGVICERGSEGEGGGSSAGEGQMEWGEGHLRDRVRGMRMDGRSMV